MAKQPAVYILASKRNGTLYIGLTGNLQQRLGTRKRSGRGFHEEIRVHRLVYYELHEDIMSAIRREKQMKKWNRGWKLELVETQNPEWRDCGQELSKMANNWIPAFAGVSAPVRAPH